MKKNKIIVILFIILFVFGLLLLLRQKNENNKKIITSLLINQIESSKFNSTVINQKDSEKNLYYSINRNKYLKELHKLSIETSIDRKITSYQSTENYIISENYVFINTRDGELKIIDTNNNKIKQVFTNADLFDYKNGEYYFYKKIEKNKICIYKTKEDLKFESECNMEVTFNPRKEIFYGYPIKLEQNIYAIYFGKLEKIPVRYKYFSVFGITLYRKPILYYEYSKKGYYLIVDVKKNKILSKIAN